MSATFNGHDALFLIDTGAGGVDVIFHKRAVEEFGLLKLVQVETYAELMGINASGKGVEVILTYVLKFDITTCSWIVNLPINDIKLIFVRFSSFLAMALSYH